MKIKQARNACKASLSGFSEKEICGERESRGRGECPKKLEVNSMVRKNPSHAKKNSNKKKQPHKEEQEKANFERCTRAVCYFGDSLKAFVQS